LGGNEGEREGKRGKIGLGVRERERFWEERGTSVREVEEKREQGIDGFWETEGREKERQRRERWERIVNSNYNRWYKVIKGRGIPGYLKKNWGENRWSRVARFRLGCEMREGNYWEEEERKVCRMCGGERESWEHVWERCRTWREGREGSWQEEVHWVLGEEGEGQGWMREVESERKGLRENEV